MQCLLTMLSISIILVLATIAAVSGAETEADIVNLENELINLTEQLEDLGNKNDVRMKMSIDDDKMVRQKEARSESGIAEEEAEEVSSWSCPEKVKSFSSGPRQKGYYKCKRAGDLPELTFCPGNHFYWAKKEVCIANRDSKTMNDLPDVLADADQAADDTTMVLADESEGSDLYTYEEQVLGRSVFLGCLFDAKKNLVMDADSFWSSESIAKNKKTRHAFSSDVTFFAAQTTYERLSKMDIDASLQLDFMGGLVSVSGSAAYLNDKTESEDVVSFLMRAHYDTRSETLPTTTPKDYSKLCSLKEGPTHVVTSISYGMDAYFTFKRKVSSQESREDISGSLQVAIKSIPSFAIEGQASIKVSQKLKNTINSIEAQLRGDFILPIQPTTFNESIKTFKQLTTHLGKAPKYEHAREMKMTLTPIARFCDKTDALLIGISETLILQATTMFNELEKTKIFAQTLVSSDAVRKYIPLQNAMNLFVTRLDTFVLKLKAKVQDILPKIRGGGAGSSEGDLIKVLNQYKSSAFNYPKAKAFLKIRMREIKTINKLIHWNNFINFNIAVVDFERANDNGLLLTKDLVMLVQFNILSDTTLMRAFLDNNNNTLSETNTWFNSPYVVSKMGKTLKTFTEFAKNNHNSNTGYLFHTTPVSAGKGDIINVFAQKNGVVLTSKFVFPEKEPSVKVIGTTYNSVTLKCNKPSNVWINSIGVSYWKIGQPEGAIDIIFQFNRSNKYEILYLETNQVYQFSAKFLTVMGGSKASSPSSFSTKPCSPPANVRANDATARSCTIKWDSPIFIGQGVEVVRSEVAISHGSVTMKVKYVEKGERLQVPFDDLVAGEAYKFSVRVFTRLRSNSSAPRQMSKNSWLTLLTNPSAPGAPIAINISHFTAAISWQPPAKMAPDATIVEYIVEYSMMNNAGNVTEPGQQRLLSSRTFTSLTISSLVQGTAYEFKVKVITSKGTSEWSAGLKLKTLYQQTDLDVLRSSLSEQVEQTVSVLEGQVTDISSTLATNIKGLQGLGRQVSRIKSDVSSIQRKDFANVIKGVSKRVSTIESRGEYRCVTGSTVCDKCKSEGKEQTKEGNFGITFLRAPSVSVNLADFYLSGTKDPLKFLKSGTKFWYYVKSVNTKTVKIYMRSYGDKPKYFTVRWIACGYVKSEEVIEEQGR